MKSDIWKHRKRRDCKPWWRYLRWPCLEINSQVFGIYIYIIHIIYLYIYISSYIQQFRLGERAWPHICLQILQPLCWSWCNLVQTYVLQNRFVFFLKSYEFIRPMDNFLWKIQVQTLHLPRTRAAKASPRRDGCVIHHHSSFQGCLKCIWLKLECSAPSKAWCHHMTCYEFDVDQPYVLEDWCDSWKCLELYNEFPSTGLPSLQASQVATLCVIETGLFKTVAVMPWKAPQVGINLNHFANHPWKDAGRKYLQLRSSWMLDSQFIKHFPKSWWLTEVEECGSISKMTIFLMFMGDFHPCSTILEADPHEAWWFHAGPEPHQGGTAESGEGWWLEGATVSPRITASLLKHWRLVS